MTAFRGALELGITFLETDLHATRDGVLVVHHDDRVDRTTNGSGRVTDFELSELQRLDAGYRFSPDGTSYPYRGQGLTIPTLEEVVSLDRGARFNVEIKQRSPDIVETFWRFIDHRNLHDRFIVAASYDPLVRRFRNASAGKVATSAGSWEARKFWAASRLRLEACLQADFDALQVPDRSGFVNVIDARFVEAAHRVGVQVHVWTIDDPTLMRHLLDLGVDGLMSDRPDLFGDAR